MESTERRRPKTRGRRNEYVNHSPAVCIVVYDLRGRPMPDADAAAIVDGIAEFAAVHGYVIDVCRT